MRALGEVALVVAAFGVCLGAARRWAFQWRSLLAFLILVVLFVPIRRYVLPGTTSFQLEPYRLFVALLVLGWLLSLLVDGRLRLRRVGFEPPLLLLVAAILCSILANGGRITSGHLDTPVFKTLTFFLSFFAIVYVVSSVVRDRDDVVFVLKVLVSSSAVVAALAVVETRTGFNFFDHLGRVPFLRRNLEVELLARTGRLRAYGPAEQPIALSAALAMVAPLAGYLAYVRRNWRWGLAMGMIVLGCLATVSRTGVLMLAVEGLILGILRPRQMKRFWPALIPLLLAVHLALPGTLGALKDSFSPRGGLAQEQQGFNGTGRLGAARLDPTFAQISLHPISGIGFGTRIVRSTGANALILDDQWLAILLETGIVGVFAWIWLFVRVIRRLMLEARREAGEEGWLLAVFAASLGGLMISMLTFDAFAFTQLAIIFFLMLALAGVVLRLRSEEQTASASVPPVVTRPAFGAGLIVIGVALVLFVYEQGPSIRLFASILGLLAIGAWAVESERVRNRLVH